MITIRHNDRQIECFTEYSEITMKTVSQFFGHTRQIVKDDVSTFDVIAAVTSAVEVFVGDVSDVPFGNINDLYKEQQITMFSELTVIAMYNHFTDALNKVPLAIEFPIQVSGDWFWLSDTIGENLMLNGIEALTVGEVIELQKIKDDLSLPIQMSEHSMEVAEKLSAQIMGVNSAMLAVLLRKKGEVLPFRIADLRTFITERARLFENLPYSVCAPISFFLQSLLQTSAMMRSIQLSLQDEDSNIE